MTDSPNAPEPRTPEQEAKMRRIGLPIGIAAAICGIVSLTALLLPNTPAGQALIAVNLSFCAMLMGIGILFLVRRIPGTRIATTASLIALLTGFAGPLVYAKFAADFRKAVEMRELANATDIANAAKQYAFAHDGHYPSDLAVLVEQKLIPLSTLYSPYDRAVHPSPPSTTASHAELFKYINEQTDYQYFGGDLHFDPAAATLPSRPEEDLFSKILLVSLRDPIERRDMSIAFTDGRAEFASLEEIESKLDKSNAARKSLGFDPVHDPEAVQRSKDLDKSDKAAGN